MTALTTHEESPTSHARPVGRMRAREGATAMTTVATTRPATTATHPGWCSPGYCTAHVAPSGAVTVEHAGAPTVWTDGGITFRAQLVAGDELAFPDETAEPELLLTAGDDTVVLPLDAARRMLAVVA